MSGNSSANKGRERFVGGREREVGLYVCGIGGVDSVTETVRLGNGGQKIRVRKFLRIRIRVELIILRVDRKMIKEQSVQKGWAVTVEVACFQRFVIIVN